MLFRWIQPFTQRNSKTVYVQIVIDALTLFDNVKSIKIFPTHKVTSINNPLSISHHTNAI